MATFIKAGFWEKLCKPCKGYKGWLNLDELIQSLAPLAPEPAYKVYTALLTQTGESFFNGIYDAPLTIGVTYQIIDDEGDGWDFTNVGAPNNNSGTYFVATGTTPNNWGTGVFLEYDEGAPVVKVLENTIGNIWFTYLGEGIYPILANSLFTINKTVVFIGQSDIGNSGVASTSYIDENNINIGTYNYNGVLTNSILGLTSIEIRIYP